MTPIKALILGESSSGKTGALASLLNAGYNVRILDLDNGVEALKNLISDPKSPYKTPNNLSRLNYITLTEPRRAIQVGIATKIVARSATVWPKALMMLNDWKVDDQSLGPIHTWTPNDVLVIDTLSGLADAAKNYHLQMNGALAKDRTGYEHQRDIGAAQDLLRGLLMLLFDTSVNCNIIVNTHVIYSTRDGTAPERGKEHETKLFGQPMALGRALSKDIPKFFNHMLLVQRDGPLARIYTKSSPEGNMNLKSGAPLSVAPFYPLESGLADYFKAVRGSHPQPT